MERFYFPRPVPMSVPERFYFPTTSTRAAAWAAPTARWAGRFTGYASVFNALVDTLPPSRVIRGAFGPSLANLVQRDRVRLLWQHDTDEPIGAPLALEEDARGLLLVGALADTPRGREAVTLLEAGVIQELSIGFDPVRWDMVDEPGRPDPVRHLREVRLWEVSLVTFGADKQARIFRVEREPTLAAAPDDEPAADPRLAQVNAALAALERESRAEARARWVRSELDRKRLALVDRELAGLRTA